MIQNVFVISHVIYKNTQKLVRNILFQSDSANNNIINNRKFSGRRSLDNLETKNS